MDDARVPLTGRCLCAAVRIEVDADAYASEVSVCHCAMCRRWSGAAMWGFDAEAVRVTGPVATYTSSPFAERSWCATGEVYADQALAGVLLAGDHGRITRSDYQRTHPLVNEDGT